MLQSSTLSYGYWDLERIVNRGDLNGLRTRISSFLLFGDSMLNIVIPHWAWGRMILNNNNFFFFFLPILLMGLNVDLI